MSLGETVKGLIFKKPAGGVAPASQHRKSKTQVEDVPYLNARRTWNDHTGSRVAAASTWQMVGILGLLIGLGGVGGAIYLGQQSKFIPYVVEVDKLGQNAAVGPAPMATPADPRVITSNLAAWITNARTVSPDVAVERRAIFSVYAFIGPKDPAAQKMNDWLNGTPESNPFARAAKVTVDVDINAVLQQTPDTWEVDWTETTRDRNGVMLEKPVQMKAAITVYYVAPTKDTTEQQMRMNPLGMYVRDFSWTKQI